MVTEGALAPQGRLLLGITGEGGFARLIRFEATAEARTVGLTELAQAALEVERLHAVETVGEGEGAAPAGREHGVGPARDSGGEPDILRAS